MKTSKTTQEGNGATRTYRVEGALAVRPCQLQLRALDGEAQGGRGTGRQVQPLEIDELAERRRHAGAHELGCEIHWITSSLSTSPTLRTSMAKTMGDGGVGGVGDCTTQLAAAAAAEAVSAGGTPMAQRE